MRFNGSELFDGAFLVALWILAAVRDFDSFGVVLVSLWTLRVILFERQGYKRLTSRWHWAPSKRPEDYRD